MSAKRAVTLCVAAAAALALGVTGWLWSRSGDPLHGAPERAPLWSARLPTDLGGGRSALVQGDVVVVQAKKGVAVLNRADGALLWQHGEIPDSPFELGADVLVADDALIAGLEVRDLRTGTLRFTGKGQALAVSRTAMFSAACFVDISRGVEFERPWTCRVSATSLRTGATLWTRRHELGSGRSHVDLGTRQELGGNRVVDDGIDVRRVPESAVLLLHESASDEAITLDAETGRELGRVPYTEKAVRLVSDTVYLKWSGPGCPAAVSGYSLRGGARRWTISIGDTVTESCTSWEPAIAETSLLTRSPGGLPQVIDLETGTTRWAGRARAFPLGMTGEVIVLQQEARSGEPAGPAGDLIGVDIASSQRLWTVPVAEQESALSGTLSREALFDRAVGHGRLVLTTQHLSQSGTTRFLLWVRDLGTGEVAWVGQGSNSILGLSDGWVVAAEGWKSGNSAEIRLFRS